jgi:hypothetical protein
MFPCRSSRAVSSLALFFVMAALSPTIQGAEGPPNQLTPEERAARWRLLFDGQSTAGWRGFKQPAFPRKGWVVEDGCLKHLARGGGGDIVTEASFDDFELSFEWRLAPKANSGLKYFITEERGAAIGHEYQLIDDVGLGYAKPVNKHRTASFYDVLAPTMWKEPHPAGQFNHTRLLVQGRHVEHWLNGLKTLEYELGSDEVRQAVAASKFKDVSGFGTKLKGHLLLQDHGGEIWFRSLKLRELPAAP